MDRWKEIRGSWLVEMDRIGIETSALSLGVGTPSFSTPKHIKQAAIDAIKKGLEEKYSASTGIPELRNELARNFRAKGIDGAERGDIFITGGAMEGVGAALGAVAEPGREVIVSSPSYPYHFQQIVYAGGKAVHCRCVEEQGWRVDTDKMRRLVGKKTSGILICNPSNPLGSVYNKNEIDELADIALENNLAIVSDETYEDFVYDGARHTMLISIPEMRERAIACYTFSKTYAMTGYRVGYVFAKGELAKRFGRIHEFMSYCAPVISQYAALAALRCSQKCVQEFVMKMERRRDFACKRLGELGFGFQKPKGAFYVFPKCSGSSLEFAKKLARQARVVVVPGIDFGDGGEGHFRVSFTPEMEDLDEAFRRMEKFLGKSHTRA